MATKPKAISARRRLTLELLEQRLMLSAAVPEIQAMVDQITEASWSDFLADITSFVDRNAYTPNVILAQDYIVSELEALGLEVELQTFPLPSLVTLDWNGQDWADVSNIIATIPGKVTPEQEYIFSAHYDSIAVHPDDYEDPFQMVTAMLSPSTPAPGADDNGSGTAALLESARIMSQYPFESTVKFIFFVAEEEGLVGSDFYTKYAYYEDPDAEEPVADPDDIRGNINYDMISYWDGTPEGAEDLDVVAYTGNTYGIESYPNLQWLVESMNPELTPEQVQIVIASLVAAVPPPPAESVDSSLLGSTFYDAATTYNTGLDINYIEGSTSDDWWLLGASDHFNFWWYGWPSLLCIEDLVYGIDPDTGYPYGTVTNPFYHSVLDNYDNCNAKDFATATTKTGVATFAEMAGLRLDVLNGDLNAETLGLHYNLEGDVTSVELEPGNSAAQLTESSPASMDQHLVIPAGTDELTFDYRFLLPGDGDSLVVDFNGDELFRITGTDVPDSAWYSANVDVSAYAGLPGVLTFGLESVGEANCRFQLDNIDLVDIGTSPPPGTPDLEAASDTGVSDTDNITYLDNSELAKALQFSVSDTIAGATVTIYADGTALGSAVAATTTTLVTTNGTYDLGDGAHTITARQTEPGKPESTDSASLGLSVDTTPPALSGDVVINQGTLTPNGRSQVRTVMFPFSEPVEVALGDFALQNRDTSAAVDISGRSLDVNAANVTVNLDDYAGDSSPQLFLQDANYTLALDGSVTDTAGNQLDVDENGTPDETVQFRFHKLLGDYSGDRSVNSTDFLYWRVKYELPVDAEMPVGPGAADPMYDLNGDSIINSTDFLMWRLSYENSLTVMADGLLVNNQAAPAPGASPLNDMYLSLLLDWDLKAPSALSLFTPARIGSESSAPIGPYGKTSAEPEMLVTDYREQPPIETELNWSPVPLAPAQAESENGLGLADPEEPLLLRVDVSEIEVESGNPNYQL